MIKEEDIKKNLVVYYVKDIDSCPEKGKITGELKDDIIGSATDHPTIVKYINKIEWQCYVNEKGQKIDSPYYWGSVSGAPLEKLFYTAEDAYEYKENSIKEARNEWSEETDTLEKLLNFPLKHTISGEDCYWQARYFYEDRIKEYLENNK